MNKLRIVEVDSNSRIHWNVQEKGWFFWYNMKHYMNNEFGGGWWTTVFTTFGEAQSFAARLISHRKNVAITPTERVVKTYEY